MRKLLGRAKIFTSESSITAENVLEVLDKAMSVHRQNVADIQFLIDYDRGKQALPRPKVNRKEIDIHANSSLPDYIKRFKKGYNWGSPIMLIQRGDMEMHETEARKDDRGISALNELLKNVENIGFLDSQMAEFIEVAGIGHRMVDIKTEFDDSGSLFNIYTLDSRFAFAVYFDGPSQRKVMAVTYAKRDEGNYYTVFTDERRFEIQGGKILRDEPNPMGMIPIIEYERSVDRTGCFERKIPEIDILNAMASDLANDSAQKTQELWWGNDIDFPLDEATGEPKAPVSGQWVLSYSGEKLNPKVQALSSNFDAAAAQNSLSIQRKNILQDCFVPIQYESAGGGSTGTATDMSSGWSAAELDACLEQQMTERGKHEEVQLILRALQFVPTEYLPADDPLRKIHPGDVNFHFARRKNYDLTNKANFVAQMLAKGFNGRHVIQVADIFPDNEQAWLDSREMIEAIQQSFVANGETDENNRIQSDNSDQVTNSPFIDNI